MDITIARFIEDHADSARFEVVAGGSGLSSLVRTAGLHRPAIELVGSILALHDHEIHLLGHTEISYLQGLEVPERATSVNRLFSRPFPCIIVTSGLVVPKELRDLAEEKRVPCLTTELPTIEVVKKVGAYLESLLAERRVIQGTLVDVWGLGTLLLGEAGVGKSEAALELVARGHRLVADDVVEVRRSPEGRLIGRAAPVIGHHAEIRGLGIVDVGRLFGARAVRNEISLQLVIELVKSEKMQSFDRTGLDEEFYEFMGSRIHQKSIQVRPGRNLGVVIEVACLDERLKQLGVNEAKEFDQRVKAEIVRKEGTARGG